MKSIIHIGFTLVLSLIISSTGKAQDLVQPISLEWVLATGGANSLTIKEYKERQNLAMANHAKAKEWWLPNIYAGVNTHQLWGNAMNGDGNFFNDVNRQSFWAGLGLNATWDFGDGAFKSQAASLEVQAMQYESEAVKNQALLSIIHSYYDFLAAQLYYKSYEQLVGQADTITQQIAVQVSGGLQYESEWLLAQSNHMHLQVEMLNAEIAYNNASAKLVKLLHLDPKITLIGTDTILAPLQLVLDADLFVPVDSAYAKRPEVKQMQMNILSLNEEKKSTTTGLLLPQLSVNTYGSYFGGMFTPFGATGAVNAALIWKIPIGRLAYRGTLKQYESLGKVQEIKLAQTKAIINEEILAARAQISVIERQRNLALQGTELAEKALKQSMQRQQLGTVRSFEILQAQELYIRSRLDYLKTVSTYNKAQYSYYVASGHSL